MEYMYISSTDSLHYHPANSTWDFTIELPRILSGCLHVALSDIKYTICCTLSLLLDLVIVAFLILKYSLQYYSIVNFQHTTTKYISLEQKCILVYYLFLVCFCSEFLGKC